MNKKNKHTEKELLKLAAVGEEKYFISLFQLYKHKLYVFLMRITESPEITEDIIQDIFLKLWKDRSTLSGIENLGGYIYRMGQNQAINMFKRMAKEKLILAELQAQTTFSASKAEENLALKDTHQKINEVIGLLSPQQKIIYTLSRNNGMRHEEIAQYLNISSSTVKNHMTQALRTIREHLSEAKIVTITSLLITTIQALEK